MNDLTFNILKLVVSVVCALIAVYLVPYLKNKLQDEKYAQLLYMVEVAVISEIIKSLNKGQILFSFKLLCCTDMKKSFT